MKLLREVLALLLIVVVCSVFYITGRIDGAEDSQQKPKPPVTDITGCTFQILNDGSVVMKDYQLEQLKAHRQRNDEKIAAIAEAHVDALKHGHGWIHVDTNGNLERVDPRKVKVIFERQGETFDNSPEACRNAVENGCGDNI